MLNLFSFELLLLPLQFKHTLSQLILSFELLHFHIFFHLQRLYFLRQFSLFLSPQQLLLFQTDLIPLSPLVSLDLLPQLILDLIPHLSLLQLFQ